MIEVEHATEKSSLFPKYSQHSLVKTQELSLTTKEDSRDVDQNWTWMEVSLIVSSYVVEQIRPADPEKDMPKRKYSRSLYIGRNHLESCKTKYKDTW